MLCKSVSQCPFEGKSVATVNEKVAYYLQINSIVSAKEDTCPRSECAHTHTHTHTRTHTHTHTHTHLHSLIERYTATHTTTHTPTHTHTRTHTHTHTHSHLHSVIER